MTRTGFPAVAPRLLAWASFIAIPLLYFIYLPVSYSFDGTVFSHMLRYSLLKQSWLDVVQIHHLVYFPLNYLVYRLLVVLFHYQVLEFFHLQLFSLFFGTATLLLVERMLKKLNLGLWLRLAGVLTVAFSYAFWLYSVDAEVHVPGLFFVCAGMYLLLFRPARFLPLAEAALCFAVAAGFHLTNGLIAVTVFFILLTRRDPLQRFVEFYLSYVAIIGLLYGAYALASFRPVLTVLYDVFFSPNIYAGYKTSAFHPAALSTFAASLGSLKNALAVEAGIWGWLLCIAFLTLFALAVGPGAAKDNAGFRQAMLFWFLPFFVFFTFWDTANIEFKLNSLLPLLLVAVTGLTRLKPVIAGISGVSLCAGLLLVNLFLGIRPQADIKNNIHYQVAAAIGRATPANAQIMIAGSFRGYGYGKIYIPYFSGRVVIILDWILGKGRSFPEIRARLEQAARSGQPLYALAEIVEDGEVMKHLLDFHDIGAGEYFRFRSGIRFIPVALLANGQRLYRLQFPEPAADPPLPG